jgi:hypothetical protein
VGSVVTLNLGFGGWVGGVVDVLVLFYAAAVLGSGGPTIISCTQCTPSNGLWGRHLLSCMQLNVTTLNYSHSR